MATEREVTLARCSAGSACSLDELDGHDSGTWRPREVDGKDASFIGQVTRIEPGTVCFGAKSAEPEPNAQAGSIGASLLERVEQFVDIPSGKSPAFVVDLDENALDAGANH
jgi:hypothetical protein